MFINSIKLTTFILVKNGSKYWKWTKRILWSLLILIVLLFTAVWILLKSSSVQTFVVGKITNSLKENLGIDVEIGRVDIEPIKTIVFEEILIRDHHQDTLFYSKGIDVDIDLFQIDSLSFGLDELSIENPVAKIWTYKDEEKSSLDVFLSKLKSKDTTKTAKTPFYLSVDDIEIKEGRLEKHDFNKGLVEKEQVDFTQLFVNDLNINLVDFHTNGTQFLVDIEKASLVLNEGIIIQDLESKVLIDSTQIRLQNFIVDFNESEIELNQKLSYNTWSDFSHLFDSIQFSGNLDGVIDPKDLNLFYPVNAHDGEIHLGVDHVGSLNSLELSRIHLKVNNRSEFNLTGRLDSLEKFESMHFDVLSDKGLVNYNDVKWLIELFSNSEFNNPVLQRIAKLNLGMEVHGGVNAGELLANVSTRMGALKVKSWYKKNEDYYSFNGDLETNGIYLGQIVDNKEVGSVDLKCKFNYGSSSKSSLDVNGTSDFIYFKNYQYSNLTFDISGDDEDYEYEIELNDRNGIISAEGIVSIMEDTLKIQSRGLLKNVYPSRFGLIQRDQSLNISSGFFTSFYLYDNYKEIEGLVRLDKFKFKESFYRYKMKSLSMEIKKEEEEKVIDVVSDWVNASVRGDFEYNEIGGAFQNWINYYLPGLKDSKIKSEADLKINVDVFDFYPIARVFDLPFKCDEINVDGEWESLDASSSYVNLGLKGLVIEDQRWENVLFEAKSDSVRAKLKFAIDTIKYGKNFYMANIVVDSKIRDNELSTNLKWMNGDKHLSSGDIKNVINFSNYPELKMSVNNSSFWLDSLNWKLSSTDSIVISDNRITLPKFLIANEDQKLEVDGVLGKSDNDEVKLSLTNLKVETFEPFLSLINLDLQGEANGEVFVQSALNYPKTEAEVKITDMVFNGRKDLSFVFESSYDPDIKRVKVDSKFIDNSKNIQMGLGGFYYPFRESNSLDMNLGLKNFNYRWIAPYLESIGKLKNGLIDGELEVSGTPTEFIVLGELELKSFRMGVDYLGVELKPKGKLTFTKDEISLNELILEDEDKQEAKMRGGIKHNQFQNISLNIGASLERFLCLNTTRDQNDLFYGTAVFSGDFEVVGELDYVILNIDGKTESRPYDKIEIREDAKGKQVVKVLKSIRETSLNIPLDAQSDLNKASFLTFKQKDDKEAQEADKVISNYSGMEVNMDIEVTPEAEVKLIFDSKVGDQIRARGNSKLKIRVNSFGKFNMYGDYNITEGDYLFTLQNLINKKFKIQEGSRVVWTGDPYNGFMDVVAHYNVKTSAFDILKYTVDQAESQRIQELRQRYGSNTLVQCLMSMKGSLLQPEIEMDLAFNDLDESTKAEVANLINTEDEKMRQIFSLMLWGKFMAPTSVSGGGSNGYLNSGVSSTTNELISNQLNLWVSQMTDDIELGFNYDSDNSGLGNNEISVEVGKQLTENLNLSTNIGVASNQDNSNVIGEFELDYRLTDNVNIKAYNESNNNNNPTQLNGNRQGVSVRYQKDFDQVSEIVEPVKNSIVVWRRIRNYFGL